MAMGFQKDRQGDLVMIWSEMPRSPGHVLHDRLQQILLDGDVDGFGEAPCRPCCAAGMGAPSVPPARCFRMHPVGHLEGIAWERGLAWRCWGSLSEHSWSFRPLPNFPNIASNSFENKAAVGPELDIPPSVKAERLQENDIELDVSWNVSTSRYRTDVDVPTPMAARPNFAEMARDLEGYIRDWIHLHRAAGRIRSIAGISEHAWNVA